MRRWVLLLFVRRWVLLLFVGLFAFAFAAPGCNIFDQLVDGSDQTNVCDSQGVNGDGAGGSGGAGGDGVGGSDLGADVGAGGDFSTSAAVGGGDIAAVGAGAGGSEGHRAPLPQPRRRRPRRHLYDKERIGTAVSADCPAPAVAVPALPPPPRPPNWIGLDTTKLRWIAIQNNVKNCANQTGIMQNRTIGLTFEAWVLKTQNQIPRWTKPIFSQQRQNANGGLPASVIPEYVDSQVKFTLNAPANLTWGYFNNSMFYEVKAVNGTLVPSTSQYQILGLLNVAQIAVPPPGPHAPPLVMFTTTSNTPISPDVVTQATAWGVAVWQQIVQYDANSANSKNPNLRIADPQCKNPTLYSPSSPGVLLVWISPGLPWPINPLTWPTDQEQDDVDVPGDPDSPAVVP